MGTNDIVPRRLDEAASALATDEPPTLVATDVSQEEGIDRLIEAATALTGQIDVFVNNAGVLLQKHFVNHTVEDWDRVLSVNLRAVFLCMRAVVPGMIEARGGSIVNVASIAGQHTTSPHVAYAVSKAGVIALTRDAAHDLAVHGIRVNAVAPGPIETAMTRDIDQGLKDAITRTTPLGRWGQPSDVGAAIAYLASDEASWVTGITMPVAGGSDLQIAYGAVSS